MPSWYYRARYYDPSAGRFIIEDPRGDNAQDLYAYVANNPVVRLDPYGLYSVNFDGSSVRVFNDDGTLALKCSATSGKPGSNPAQQGSVGVGPIPKGTYLIYPEEFSGGPGIHTIIRDLFGNWGTWRIPIHPVPGQTNTYGRSGFFFHGGGMQGAQDA